MSRRRKNSDDDDDYAPAQPKRLTKRQQEELDITRCRTALTSFRETTHAEWLAAGAPTFTDTEDPPKQYPVRLFGEAVKQHEVALLDGLMACFRSNFETSVLRHLFPSVADLRQSVCRRPTDVLMHGVLIDVEPESFCGDIVIPVKHEIGWLLNHGVERILYEAFKLVFVTSHATRDGRTEVFRGRIRDSYLYDRVIEKCSAPASDMWINPVMSGEAYVRLYLLKFPEATAEEACKRLLPSNISENLADFCGGRSVALDQPDPRVQRRAKRVAFDRKEDDGDQAGPSGAQDDPVIL